MKQLLAVVGVLMIVTGGLVTSQAFGWFGPATQSSIQAIGGPLIAGLGVALIWVTVMGRAT